MKFHDLEIWKFWYEPPGSKFGNLNTWLNVKNKEETYFPSYYVKNKIDLHFVGRTLYREKKVLTQFIFNFSRYTFSILFYKQH